MLYRVTPEANIPGKLEGVLLCGGRSSRMGRDKALIAFEGEALWLRQRRLLRELLGKEPLISVRSGTRLAEDEGAEKERAACGRRGDAAAMARYVFDDGSSGPLGGILAALEAMSDDARMTHLVVLAVDMPFMEMAWWATLLRACSTSTGAIGRQASAAGWEPLAAIYPVGMATLFRSAREQGKLSLQDVVLAGVADGLLREILITAQRERFFRNWNTPKDLE